jgi:protein-S-isoprenylcysteine O-methyltransferase Ste14
MDVSVQTVAQRRLNNFGFLLGLFALPSVVWYATIAIRYYDGALAVPDLTFLSHIAAPSLPTLGFYLGWLALQVGLALVVPGKVEAGMALEDGRSLDYTMNGLWAFLITLAVAIALPALGVLPATFLHDQLDALVTSANIVVELLCLFMFVIGRRQASAKERLLNPIEAYFVGAALNPRSGKLDWKFFCESRPGMILWVLLNLSFAATQQAKFGAISNGMWLVCAFQLLYVADYFVNEDAILTTWDIRHEPFGFMLCWGSLVWVPFTFSLQGLYLSEHPHALSTPGAIVLVCFNLLGYAIFRGANLQKHKFRKLPETRIWGRAPEFIETTRGTKLLVSGFWGIARHSNYLGDLMMGLAWCLTTGFHSVLTYFYFSYFVILLVHRERRDHEHCARKYGSDWERYTARVRWRILPFVY